MDQLYDTILETVDFHGNLFSCFVIAMKGSKIAFFQFYSFISLLDENDIAHYNGFIPLNQLLTQEGAYKIKGLNPFEYNLYTGKYSDILTKANLLKHINVESTKNIPHPLWDLLNENHKEHVHNLFVMVRDNIPGSDINK